MIPFWRKKHQEKEAFVLKNGGILLEQLITTFDGKRNPIRNFSSKKLKLATNNYDTMNVIMVDSNSFFKLYKGFLLDRQISVIKYESNNEGAYNDCINNIVFSLQMCHKHILKLIGYCLETQVPILVFESLVKYGTLKDHILSHREPHLESLSWRQRLKISMEIANAFAYLHVGFPRPIVYSNMNSSVIILDEHFVPKLIDFSNAECIPEGKTHINDAQVRGYVGYIAPELCSGVLNEKCDVYGFGALLLELLSGRLISKTKDIDFESSSEPMLWNKIIKDNSSIIELVDPIIVGDGLCSETQHQLIVFAELAIKCLSVTPENRPTMIEVAKRLRQLYGSAS